MSDVYIGVSLLIYVHSSLWNKYWCVDVLNIVIYLFAVLTVVEADILFLFS